MASYPPVPKPSGDNDDRDCSRSHNDENGSGHDKSSLNSKSNNQDHNNNASRSRSDDNDDDGCFSSSTDDTDDSESENESPRPSLVQSQQLPFFSIVPLPPHHHIQHASGLIPLPPPAPNFCHQPMAASASSYAYGSCCRPDVPPTTTHSRSGNAGVASSPFQNGQKKSNKGNKSNAGKVGRGTKRRKNFDHDCVDVDLTNKEEKKDDAEFVVAPSKVPINKKNRHPLASRYPHLAEFGLPLGETTDDHQRREIILSELVRFQSSQYCQRQEPFVENRNDSNFPDNSSQDHPSHEKASNEMEINTDTAKPSMTGGPVGSNKRERRRMRKQSAAVSCKEIFIKIRRHNKFRYDYLIPVAQKSWNASKCSKPPAKQDVSSSSGSAIEALLELWFKAPENNEGGGYSVAMKERKDAAARYMLKYLSVAYRHLYVDHLTKNDEIKKQKKGVDIKKKTRKTTQRDDDIVHNNVVGHESLEAEGCNATSVSLNDLLANTVIHDGSEPSRKNLRWNLMYQRLADYKELFGDFHIYAGRKTFENRDKSKDSKKKIPVDWKKVKFEMEQRRQEVSSRISKDCRMEQMHREQGACSKEGDTAEKKENQNDDEKDGRLFCNILTTWVKTQRNLYHKKSPELTPRRIELLENIGFPWERYPDLFVVDSNIQYHKAVAARLCFNLTSFDSLILAGFPVEEAQLRKRTHLVRSHSANLYRPDATGPKGQHIKSKIEFWMNKIYEAGKLKNDEAFFNALEEIYGPSDYLFDWYSAGRIVLNRLHPSKRKRTDETLSEDGKTYVSHRPTGADIHRRLTPL